MSERFWPVPADEGAVAGGSHRRGWLAAIPPAVAVMALAAVVAVAASSSPWLHAYQISGAKVFLWSAAAASVLLSTATTRVAKQRPAVAYGASLLGLLLFSLALTGPHPALFLHGMTHGPALLVSETLPLVGSRALFATPLLLTWVCGAATSELLWRVRTAPVGLVVPVLGFVAAYAVTSGAPGDDVVAGSVLLAAMGFAAVAAHHKYEQDTISVEVPAAGEDSPPRPGQSASKLAAAGVAGLAVVLGVVVPKLPGANTTPTVLARVPTAASPTLVSPVAAIANLRNQSATGAHPLMTVMTNQPSTGYLGVATLDNYDGGSWTFDTTFRPTGGRVPPVPTGAPGFAAGRGSTLTQRYTLDGAYRFQLIPAADRPTEVRGFGVAADAATGMVVPTQNVRPPTSYEVTSRAPTARLDTVSGADGIGVVAGQRPTAVEAADLALPPGSSVDVATAVRYIASLTGLRPVPTVAFLQAALAAMREYGKDQVPGGLSVPSVGTGLAEVINATTVTHTATPEQWATMFATLARYLGVPARLVTGFRIKGPDGGAGLVPAGRYTLTGKDAWTWVEIPIAGVGWVVADPTPTRTSTASGSLPKEASSPATTIRTHQANAVPAMNTPAHAVAPRVHIPRSPSSGGGLPGWAWALVSLGAFALLAALVPTVAAGRRWSRRRARRSAVPDELAVGAWLELLDSLERAGLRLSDSATTAEVVADSEGSFSAAVAPNIAAVGAVADRAVFATTSVDLQSAERAWRLQEAARRDLLGRLDRVQLVRASVTVGHQPRRPRRQ